MILLQWIQLLKQHNEKDIFEEWAFLERNALKSPLCNPNNCRKYLPFIRQFNGCLTSHFSLVIRPSSAFSIHLFNTGQFYDHNDNSIADDVDTFVKSVFLDSVGTDSDRWFNLTRTQKISAGCDVVYNHAEYCCV